MTDQIISDRRGTRIVGQIDIESWIEHFNALLDDKEKTDWSLADMVIAAEGTPIEPYIWQFIPASRINERTLQNKISLARRFPYSERKWSLSQRHYDAAKGLTDTDCEYILSKAEQEDLSSDEVREWVRSLNPTEVTRASAEGVIEQFERGWFISTDDALPKELNEQTVKVTVTLKRDK